MSSPERRSSRNRNVSLFFLLMIVVFIARRRDDQRPESTSSPVSTPVENPIESAIKSPPARETREGVAAAILIDTSGSMTERVSNVDGVKQPKIEIARRAAIDLVSQFDSYAKEHSDKPILLGVYEFSDRDRQPSTRTVIKPGPPNAVAAHDAIMRMHAEGGTPIGNAMIQAKRDLDATGLSKRHILVITDGENTAGYAPQDVTRAIVNQTDNNRASIYFVAFDVAASKFNAVKDAGGLVLAASNETGLRETLDYLLTGKILAEQPEQR